MAVALICRVKAENFDTWLKPDPDALVQMFQPQGVLAFSVHRGADDPNSATTIMEFADRDAVDAFEAWYAGANVEYQEQRPGAAHEIVDRWVGEVVPSHSRRLG